MNKTLLACALALACIGSASAANIIIVNTDAAGAGLNDPTPATPIGGNPGTTVGEQRRIVFQFAADQWGALLQSNIDIRIRSSFAPLTCDAGSGVLAQAGALSAHANFPNAPVAASFYNAALANSLANADLAATDDIQMTFNANLGQPACIAGSAWYYGLDGITPGGGGINFLDTAMHEMGHGLNFQGRYNTGTGAPPAAGFTDIYSTFVYDNATAKAWTAMTNGERVAAAIGGNLVWTGPTVTAQVPATLGPLTTLNVTGTLTASYNFGTAGFGAVATPANFAGAAVIADDGTGATGSQACNPLTNGAAVTGKVAVVDRGTCAFTVKALNAQNAGATAVIVVNNVAGSAPGLGGADPAVTVPTISLSQADGTALKAAVPGANVALGVIPGALAGADSTGRARLYAPNPLQPGSSFSHFDTSHSPNAIMEPAISGDLDGNFRLDLTPGLFKDVGWVLNDGNATTRKGNCNTGVPVRVDPGLIPGANLQAADKLCRNANVGNTLGYRSCVNAYVSRLATAGLIPSAQAPSIKACTTR